MSAVREYLYVWRLRPQGGAGEGCLVVSTAPCPADLSRFLPPDCAVLLSVARAHLKGAPCGGALRTVIHSELCDAPGGGEPLTAQRLRSRLREAGIRRLPPQDGIPGDRYACRPKDILDAIRALREPRPAVKPVRPEAAWGTRTGARGHTHGAADALDWNEAMELIERLRSEGRYRDMMLVGSGCFLGLRISDILRLRWDNLIGDGDIALEEKKTGKTRRMRVNPRMRALSEEAYDNIGGGDPSRLVFESWARDEGQPISRQRADQILKEIRARYGVRSAATFSTHSLRKTFGRRVWLQECRKGRGEQALLLLCEVFGHSSIDITKRYLGIRQEEILSVYDSL